MQLTIYAAKYKYIKKLVLFNKDLETSIHVKTNTFTQRWKIQRQYEMEQTTSYGRTYCNEY